MANSAMTWSNFHHAVTLFLPCIVLFTKLSSRCFLAQIMSANSVAISQKLKIHSFQNMRRNNKCTRKEQICLAICCIWWKQHQFNIVSLFKEIWSNRLKLRDHFFHYTTRINFIHDTSWSHKKTTNIIRST